MHTSRGTYSGSTGTHEDAVMKRSRKWHTGKHKFTTFWQDDILFHKSIMKLWKGSSSLQTVSCCSEGVQCLLSLKNKTSAFSKYTKLALTVKTGSVCCWGALQLLQKQCASLIQMLFILDMIYRHKCCVLKTMCIYLTNHLCKSFNNPFIKKAACFNAEWIFHFEWII